MRRPSWLPIALILATLLSLSYWLWARTGEIILDFGNELYIAWQLSQGKTLYRDVAYLFGPLSPTFNSILMRIFGPGVATILVANLIILILTTLLLHQLLRVMSTALAAVTATIFFLCVFALSAPTRLTNYNFLTPYAHPITHGFLLCLAAIACVDWFYRRQNARAAIAGGLLTGLAFLTKPEIFLGCASAYFLGLMAAIWLTRPKRVSLILISAIVATILPPVAAFVWFAARIPAHAALDGVLSGWQFVANSYVLSTPFYKGSFGTDQPAANFLLMLEYAAFYAIAAAVLALAARIFTKLFAPEESAPWPILLFVAGGACYCLLRLGDHFESFWVNAARGLPLVAILFLIFTFRNLSHAKADRANPRRALLLWTLAILSLSFLAKIFLYARLYQYGFVLAAPCAMMAIIALLDWFPDWMRKKSASPAIARAGAIGFLAAFVVHSLIITQHVLNERTVPIPLALGGTAWTRPNNSASVSAIRWLTNADNLTAAIIPDAAGISYAAAKPSSIPFNELHPLGLRLYGQSAIVESFNAHPPDLILIVAFSETALGARAFGRDYGLDLSKWIAHHYRPIAIFSTGDHPITVWLHNPAKSK